MKITTTLWLGVALLGTAHADIVFEAEPPKAPERAPLVQLANTPLSRQSLMNRAAEFGVRQGRLQKNPRGLSLLAGSVLIAQDTFGSEFFADTDRYMVPSDTTKPPLPDAEAVKLAMDALRARPGRVNLGEVKLERVRHLMNQGQDLRSGALTPATQDGSIVVFRREIGGIPVVPTDGSGEHVRVVINNAGDITGQRALWRNARTSRELLLIRPYNDIRELLVRRLTAEMGNSKSDAIIKNIQFGYFGRPEGEQQGWLQPAYVFQVQFRDPEERQVTAARRIPVLAIDPKESPEPLEPPDRPSEAGPRENIRFKSEPGAIPQALPAFTLTPVDVTPDSIKRRATAFNLGNGELKSGPRGLFVSDGRRLLFQDRGGAEFYSDTERMLNEKPGEAPAQSDAIVIRQARTVVESLGFPKDQLGSPVVRRLRQRAFDIQKQQPGPETLDEAIVEFPRVVTIPGVGGEPIPCVGEGAFVRIHLDNAGNLTGAHSMWRNVNAEVKVHALRPYETIREEFVRHLQSELGHSLADVVGVRYGVYFRPEGFDQEFAQPAVVFEVDLIDPETGQVTAHRQIPVPAGPELSEPLDDPAQSIVPNNPESESTREVDVIPALYGDVNEDGQVNTQDVAATLRITGGLAEPSSAAAIVAGDLTPLGFADGRLTVTDGLRILRAVFQLDNITNGP